ncbi:MAG: redoxin domain-containing protein [Planctomycetes bacterium]|nr:redoxin domain-containing protein [Planctomycetota bacterium]
MQRIVGGILVLLLGLSVAAAGDERGDKPATPTEQYQALLKEFYDATHVHFTATTEEERKKAVARVDKLPLRLLELAEKNPNHPIALDALIQVVSQEIWLEINTSYPGWGKHSPGARAIALLLRHHLRSDKLGEACRRIAYGFRQECETFLRTVLEMNPHKEVQALACLRLAQFLNGRLQRLDLVKERPELAKRYEGLFGKDYLEALRRQDRAKAVKEAEALFERAADKYGDVKVPYGGTVAEKANAELFEIRHLAVGREAADIEGEDQDGKRFKLNDYRGKVVLLYFWSEY